MKPRNKDISVLEHILNYCLQIEETVNRFGNSQEIFISDTIYRNAAALCILQIGELTEKLSDEFRAEYRNIPWLYHMGDNYGRYSGVESFLH